ncbi:hypothetical protein [Nitriliruptor alkaliphilus]|uniref:hypothetical protein n=1 Tax=Nitriliruptor alkaliphilus TaxID=427918 RepID=UPI000696F297|nr:hypothetical protein [Nitriliruptor alkaliphilus]
MALSSRPAWLVEALDVVERRGGLLRAAVGGLVGVGLIVTVLAPGILPRQPLVGAAVAVAAILIGLAITIAVDAGDATIRGPRHVRSAGGELVGVLPTQVSPAGAGDLAASVLDARAGRRVVLGLSGTGRGVDAAAWTDALGVALAEQGASVLIVDVASGATPHEGLLEVVRDGASLGHTVTFERDIKLARLGAGRDLDEAMRAAAALPERLPKDLEVLLVALPPLADRDVLAAAGALNAVLLLARSDATPRVRLQAGIEALEGAGTVAQVVLIDDRTARTPRREVPSSPADGAEPSDEVAVDEVTDAPLAEPSAEADEDPVVAGPEASEPVGAVGPQPVAATAPETAEPELAEAVAEAASETARPELAEPEVAEPEVAEPEIADLAPVDPEPVDPEPVDPEPVDPEPVEPEPIEPETAEPEVAEAAPDRWSGPPLSTPRAELERRPAPSVRVVRDLPPSPRQPHRPDDAATPEVVTASKPERSTPPASPQDLDVVSGAAAARLAAQLASTVTPPAAPDPVVAPTPGPEPAPEAVVGRTPESDPVPEPEPVAVVPPEPEAEAAPRSEPEPEPAVAPDVAVNDLADPTDEIPAVRDERLAAPQPEDDPLRTTAQLALLMDELHERDEVVDVTDVADVTGASDDDGPRTHGAG